MSEAVPYPPFPQGSSQPGELPKFGPAFVPWVAARFAEQGERFAKLVELLESRAQTYEFFGTSDTDGSGNVTVNFETVPVGNMFDLHRLVVDASGYTFGSPYTNASGYVEIQRNQQMVDGVSLASGSGQLPTVYVASARQAQRFHGGDSLSVKVVTGPASKTLRFVAQGILLPEE